jgi:hypothetical protein
MVERMAATARMEVNVLPVKGKGDGNREAYFAIKPRSKHPIVIHHLQYFIDC